MNTNPKTWSMTVLGMLFVCVLLNGALTPACIASNKQKERPVSMDESISRYSVCTKVAGSKILVELKITSMANFGKVFVSQQFVSISVLHDKQVYFPLKLGLKNFVSLPYDPTTVAEIRTGESLKLPMSKPAIFRLELTDKWFPIKGKTKELKDFEANSASIVIKFTNKFWDGKKVVEDKNYWSGEIIVAIQLPANKKRGGRK